MFIRLKKIVITTLIAVCVVSTFSFPAMAEVTVPVATDYWMSVIPDDTSIKDITIPGTHDSATRDIGTKWTQPKENALRPWAVTQGRSITEQLYNGIRLFDLRLSYSDDEVGLYHGSGFFSCYCNLNLTDAINQINDFLEDHQSETVIVTLKNEDGSSMSDNYRSRLNSILDSFRDNENVYTDNAIPTLGEVRGKIVIYNRLTECGINIGINYSDNSTIEDSFECFSSDKINAVEESLQNIENGSNDSEKIVVTYTSTNPITNFEKTFSNFSWYDYINIPKLIETLTGHLQNAEIITTASAVNSYLWDREMDAASCYGWFYMDMPTEDLIEKIYKINYRNIDI